MTTIEETITKLSELKLTSMIAAVRELQQTAPGHELSFDEKLGIVVDREWTDRENRRLARRIKDAKLSTRASLDNVLSDPERGIEKATIRQFATCGWTKAKQNVVLVGKTGVGADVAVAAGAGAGVGSCSETTGPQAARPTTTNSEANAMRAGVSNDVDRRRTAASPR